MIIPANNGTTAPKYYDGTTFDNLAGSPPAGQYVGTWKDRLVLGGSSANPNRSWFSALDDATTWDTTNGWVNTIGEVRGYAALPNALLIFGPDATVRVRGSIPPPGSDFIIDDPIFNLGCEWPNSIAVLGTSALFANQQGVWITNGTSMPQDLTAICGVKTTWQRAVASRGAVGPPSAVAYVTGGFVGNYYLVTVRYADGTSLGFLFNLTERTCVEISNVAAYSVAMTPQKGDELYLGMKIGSTPRVIYVSPIFISDAASLEDASGVDILPRLYTRNYGDNRFGAKRWKNVYLDYYLADNASNNPTLSVYYEDDERSGDGIGTLAATLTETTSAAPAVRRKIPIHKSARGMSFQIEQAGLSADTNIIALLADVHAREASRVG